MSGPTYAPLSRPEDQIMGMPLVPSLHVPEFAARVALSSSVIVSDKFRAEFDAWLTEFFGRERVYWNIRSSLTGRLCIFAHPESIRALKKQCAPMCRYPA